jgi:hypothetical protein
LQTGQELVRDVPGGSSIRPNPYHPRRTSFIPYYSLMFDTNDLFLAQIQLPTFNTATFDNPSDDFAAMDAGTIFTATASPRAMIVNVLQGIGYSFLKMQADTELNTAQYLAWPALTYMSHTSETTFTQPSMAHQL